MADPDISGQSLQLCWMAASKFSFQPAKAIASRDVRQTLVNLHLNSSGFNSGLWIVFLMLECLLTIYLSL